jgi:hypothetical protein
MSGSSGIKVTVNGEVSNTYPFTVDDTGDIYFVSPTGSDSNNGRTVSTAWRTLEHATYNDSPLLGPGDFLYLVGGTYNEGGWYIGYHNKFQYDGTAAERITMTSYPGEEAIITGGGSLDIYSSYWTLARLTFGNIYIHLGAQKSQCTENPNNVRDGLEAIGNEFTGRADHCIQSFSDNCVIQGNYIDLTPIDSTSYPLYMSSGSNRQIKDNYIAGGSKWLIHVFDEDRPNCNDVGRVLSGTIEGNLLNATNSGQGRDGAVIIQANSAADVFGYTVKNNILYSTDGAGTSDGFLRIRHNVDGVYVYNNTFYNAGGNFIRITDSVPDNIVIKNNIFHTHGSGSDVTASSSGQVTVENNLYYPSKNLSGTSDGSSIEADPQFVSAGSYNFHLQSASPARDAGLTIGEVTRDYEYNPRPQGSGYDIGAYEYY